MRWGCVIGTIVRQGGLFHVFQCIGLLGFKCILMYRRVQVRWVTDSVSAGLVRPYTCNYDTALLHFLARAEPQNELKSDCQHKICKSITSADHQSIPFAKLLSSLCHSQEKLYSVHVIDQHYTRKCSLYPTEKHYESSKHYHAVTYPRLLASLRHRHARAYRLTRHQLLDSTTLGSSEASSQGWTSFRPRQTVFLKHH